MEITKYKSKTIIIWIVLIMSLIFNAYQIVEINRLKRKYKSLNYELRNKEDEIQNLEEEKSNLENEKNYLEDENSDLEDEKRDLEDDLDR